MSATILVIDDSVDTLQLLSIMLRKAGYEVMTATSGEEGIEKYNHRQPDCIILDWMMPKVSGIDTLKLLNKIWGVPPVILFTAKNQIPDVITGMEAGAFKFLVKTSPREKILQTVQEALAQPRVRATRIRTESDFS